MSISRQRVDELEQFIALLQAEKVTRYLEIGTCAGGTFHAVMTALPVGAHGIAVDLPEAKWGKPNSRAHLDARIEELCQVGYHCQAIYGDSRTEATRAQVGRYAPFDAVLIDGDHTIEAVTSDWQVYGSMARIVAFHDIDGTNAKGWRGHKVEVPQLWRALKRRYRTREIIGQKRGMGIGILWQ